MGWVIEPPFGFTMLEPYCSPLPSATASFRSEADETVAHGDDLTEFGRQGFDLLC